MTVSYLEAVDSGKWFPFLGPESKIGLLVPGTQRERGSEGEREREEEVEEEDEVEEEQMKRARGRRAVGKGPGSGAAFTTNFAVIAWEAVSGSVSHLSHISPSPPLFFFFLWFPASAFFGQTQPEARGQGTQGCSPVVKLLRPREEEHNKHYKRAVVIITTTQSCCKVLLFIYFFCCCQQHRADVLGLNWTRGKNSMEDIWKISDFRYSFSTKLLV